MLRPIALSAVGLFGILVALPAQAHPPKTVLVPPPVIVERPAVFASPCPVYCLDTFARDFRPVEGRHHIQIIHPVTKCPVDVCFDLPCGKLREVEVNRRSIEFDYGKHEVRILFRHNGTVDVKQK